MNMLILSVILLALVILNLLSLTIFYLDKARARKNEWRISEGTLLILAFFGPFGAFAAMKKFRHKTHKNKFLLVPIFMIIQIVIAGYLVYRYISGEALAINFLGL